ncbi:EamA-like transporter family protein [Paraliobacillus sp. PM-2]|nr:EamA-like transporter family protein [Paraliobacillus sp. PM-2]
MGGTHTKNGIFSATFAYILWGFLPITAVPLLLFAIGAKRISLSMVGFLQYIAPTFMLLIGVFLYQEVFTSAHMIAFVCIWTALAIYTTVRFVLLHRLRRQVMVR